MLRVPTNLSDVADWARKAATSLNQLIARAVQKDGATIYTAPTISNPPTQAQVQAIADALAAVSTRLKG
jgi:hypothetical protein